MKQSFSTNTDGNMAVVLAAVVGIILFALGFALDMANAQSTRSKMQNALDTAALQAALATDHDDFVRDGKANFKQNFPISSVEMKALNFVKSDDESEVIATARAHRNLAFAGLIGKDYLDISVRSVVKIADPINAPCIMALSQTKVPGIIFNGGASIQGPDCEIHSHVRNGHGVYVNAGIDIDVAKTCVASRQSLVNSPLDSLEMSCDVAPNPLAGRIPEPEGAGCTFSSRDYRERTLTLTPGVYCGWHNFMEQEAQIIFEPGLYVLRDGGWNVNGGNWSGDGVTFYFDDAKSKIQFNSAAKAKMTAPSTGPYAGIFIAQREGLKGQQAFILNDENGFDFEGAIYLPTSEVIFNGGVSARARNMKIIGHTLIFNSADLTIDNAQASRFASPTNPYLRK